MHPENLIFLMAIIPRGNEDTQSQSLADGKELSEPVKYTIGGMTIRS